jgi:hypothetical protein
MRATFAQYTQTIRDIMRLDGPSETAVLSELEAHIEDRVEEMKIAGLSDEEAEKACASTLGPAGLIGRQFYEIYNQGTWRQAVLAAMPHLLFAFMFMLNWWQQTSWLMFTLAGVTSMALYAWARGNSAWLFPWRGFYLMPVVAAGFFLLYLPRNWSWLAIPVFLPLAIWLIFAATIKTIKRDWLYAALMTLPVPVMLGWWAALGQPMMKEWISVAEKTGTGNSVETLHNFGPAIALTFFMLALAVVAFMRVRQRWLRGTVLVVSGLVTLTIVDTCSSGRLSPPVFMWLAFLSVALFLTPGIFDRKFRRIVRR